jgi:hypothetical protein
VKPGGDLDVDAAPYLPLGGGPSRPRDGAAGSPRR